MSSHHEWCNGNLVGIRRSKPSAPATASHRLSVVSSHRRAQVTPSTAAIIFTTEASPVVAGEHPNHYTMLFNVLRRANFIHVRRATGRQ